MSIITKKKKLNNILKLIETPDPYRSLEDYEKYLHKDLQNMDKAELWKERKRTEIALAITEPDEYFCITDEGCLVSTEGWRQERLKKIIDELRKIAGNKTFGIEQSLAQQTRKEPAGWI